MNSPGRLMLKPLEARINRNTEWFGHMDPFVRFQFDNQRFQSQVSKGGGINPVWNDVITFNKFNGHLLYIALLDHQTVKEHDLIGTTQIDISDIFIKTEPTTKIIDLFHDGLVAAKIQIYFFFEATINQKSSFGGGGSLIMSKKHKQNMNNQFNQSGNNNSQGYNSYQPQPYQNNQNQFENSYSNQQNSFNSNQYNNGNIMQNQQYSQPYQHQQQNNLSMNNSKQSPNFQQVIANQFGMKFSQQSNNKPIQPPKGLPSKLPQILQVAKPQNNLYPSLSTKYDPIKVQQAPPCEKQEQKPLQKNKSTKSITQEQNKDFTAEQMDDILK